MKKCSTAALSLAFISAAMAGDLDPPAGAIEPTMKTLDTVEPRVAINDENTAGDSNSVYRIDAAGSYYLTENVIAGPGFAGIEVNSINVTIDLNGYTIVGAGSDMLDGISGFGSDDVTVRNGFVQNFGRDGISLGERARVTGVTVKLCGQDGIDVVGDGAIIRDCAVVECGSTGVATGSGSVVSGCRVDSCGMGFRVGSQSKVEHCDAIANSAGDGFLAEEGLSDADGVVFIACTARDNAGNGFSAGVESSARDCVARDNGGDGFTLSIQASLVNCVARSNGAYGIFVTGRSTVRDCSTVINGLDGFRIGNGSTITGCTADTDQSSGIDASSDCNITNNSVQGCEEYGIDVGLRCIVRGNTCAFNNKGGILAGGQNTIAENECHDNDVLTVGGAGVRVTGSRNRVEANNVSDNEIGIDIESSGNIIVRNTASSNFSVNYNIVGGNDVGTIQSSPVGAGPWDNFEY